MRTTATTNQHDVAASPAMAVPDPSECEHITIWNRAEKRKIAGNAAPLRRNLDRYLAKHPDCEIFVEQDIANGAKRRKVAKPRRTVYPPPQLSSTNPVILHTMPQEHAPSEQPVELKTVELDPWLVGSGEMSWVASDEDDDSSIDAILCASEDTNSTYASQGPGLVDATDFEENVYLSLPDIGERLGFGM